MDLTDKVYRKLRISMETKPTYTYTFKLADIEYVDNRAIFNYFNVYRNSYDRLNNIAQTLTSNNSPYLNEEGDLALPTGADLFINHVLNQRTSPLSRR